MTPTRYVVRTQDRTGKVTNTWQVDQIYEVRPDAMDVEVEGEGVRTIDLRMAAVIEITDRLRMGVL